MVTVTDLAAETGIPEDIVRRIYTAGQASVQPSIISSQPRVTDIVLSRQLYEAAYREGVSFSAYLEKLDPSSRYDGELAKLDAFERQLYVAGIRVHSDPRSGVYADRVQKFFDSEKADSAYLLPEFMARIWRSAAYGQRFYLSSAPVSSVLHPDYIQETIRAKQIEPAIPLSEIVALITQIDSDVYRAFYLVDSEADRQMTRVTEGSEIPTATLTGGDHTIRLRKYGRRLVASYETIRRMPIDRFALHIAQLAVQSEGASPP